MPGYIRILHSVLYTYEEWCWRKTVVISLQVATYNRSTHACVQSLPETFRGFSGIVTTNEFNVGVSMIYS